MKAVILAAGVGSRLGQPFPKALSQLPTGERILGRQIRILREHGIKEIIVVVGFKKEFIMEYFPGALYKYNPLFYLTNTSKSLLMGLQDCDEDVLWMNGDVICDEAVINRVLQAPGNAVAVNSAHCGEEEVKYQTDGDGYLKAISKRIKDPQGEAVGVNKISREDIESFRKALDECEEHDYFERGIEILIAQGKRFETVDIFDCRCVEVDFPADWEVAVSLFRD